MPARNFVVLEKDDDLRTIYRKSLEKKFQGCVVIDAPSCEEALAALNRSPVDAVVVNQAALDCTGLDALKAIRQAHAAVPMVSVGPASVEDIALQNGATVFLGDHQWQALGKVVESVLPPSA